MSDEDHPVEAAENGDDEDSENPLAHLPEYVIARVEKLRELHTKRDDIMEKYLVERAALEQKYAMELKPLYEERSSIILGHKDGEIASETNTDGHQERATSDESNDEPRIIGIPQFWVGAMTNQETIGELIEEDDVDCLVSLTDVTCVDHENGRGFTLYFHFAPNDYFENKVLQKSYDVPNLLLSDEPILKNVKGTQINWKPGRALTYRITKKKQRGKGKNAGQVRTVEKKEDIESFFRWFEPPDMPPLDTMDEQEAEQLEEYFDSDYEVAKAFRSDLIPQAVLWFTGEAEEKLLMNAIDEIEQAHLG